jgi:hypothetical protein
LRATELNQQRQTPVFSTIQPATNYKNHHSIQHNQWLMALIQIEHEAPATSKRGSGPARRGPIGPCITRLKFE